MLAVDVSASMETARQARGRALVIADLQALIPLIRRARVPHLPLRARSTAYASDLGDVYRDIALFF